MSTRARAKNVKNNAIFMILLMIAAPVMTLQTGLLARELQNSPELEDNPVGKSLTSSGSSNLPDCTLGDVVLTEVYHSSGDWIEIYNSGNQSCDLGEWHIRDDDTNSGMVLANGTNITSGEFMLFSYSDGDFNFDISYSDSILFSDRNTTIENATVATTLDYYGRDNQGYSTSRDGSWELCDGVWDYNEPNEMTPNATNLCAGEPFMLYVMDSDGSWIEDPDSIPNASSPLVWNTSNLDIGQSYYMYHWWSTEFESRSNSFTFTADGEDIEIEVSSDYDWTCNIDFNAYVQNSSSGSTIEYYTESLDVECGEEISEFKVLDSSSVELSDGHNLSSGNKLGSVGFVGGNTDRAYRTVYTVSFDDEVVAFSDKECDYGQTSCLDSYQINIPSHVCDVDFDVSAYVLTPHQWLHVGEETREMVGDCDGTDGDPQSVMSLYAMMDDANGGQSWTEVYDDGVNDVLNMSASRTQSFYWDIDDSAIDSNLRISFSYEGDQVMDRYFQYDGQPIYWNATVLETECNPRVYGYLYTQLPDGDSHTIASWSDYFETDCDDYGEADLHVHNMSNTWTVTTNNGSTDMIWNLSDLVVGEEYLFEWYTYRSSSYTASGESQIYGEYYNRTIFTAPSEYTHLNWTLETPGEWCDVDLRGYLYVEFEEAQEWWEEDETDDEKWTEVWYNNHDLNPHCDGTEVAPYEPVSLWHLDQNNTWVLVDDSTNLSTGVHQMKWQVSGANEDQSMLLNTQYESYLNSSWLYSSYEGTGDFDVIWELPISDWSCNIDIEFDLYFLSATGNTYRMDHEIGNPFIDGPCNAGLSISGTNEPDFSLSLVDSDGSLDDLNDAELEEGNNTLRWSVEGSMDGLQHYVTMYLRYNNRIQEIDSEVFFGDSADHSGDFTFNVDGPVCDYVYVQSKLHIRGYNGLYHADTQSYNLAYDGSSTGCDYEGPTMSKLSSDGTWEESPNTLEAGNNQVRFNLESFGLHDNSTYYISSSIQGEGSLTQSLSTYFNIGQPSNQNYWNYDDYDGRDVYLNYTVEDWTCSSTASITIYYIDMSGSWNTYASMQTRHFQNPGCDPAGDLSVSAVLDGQWEEELELYDNDWDISAGTTDLYWNMSQLNIGERYNLYFYAYLDNEDVYSYAGNSWFADSETESWHFDLDLDGSECNIYGYGYLRIYIEGYGWSTLDYDYFHPDEPCIAPFELQFEDATEFVDATTSILPTGTVQMLFNLSELGHGDYEIDYYWWGDESGGNGWYYDNQITVNETIDGFYWNMTLDDEDCEVYVRARVYEIGPSGNDQVGGEYRFDMGGPCVLPAKLEILGEDGTYLPAVSELFTAGTNQMRWNLSNLEVGSDYRLDYYYNTQSEGSSQWTYLDFTHDGSNVDWDLDLTLWDCNVAIYVYVYNDTAGGSQMLYDQWYYYPSDCSEGGTAYAEVNRTYGWTGVDSNHNVEDGTTEMRWRLADLDANQSYAFEWITERNGHYTSHDSFFFNSTSSEEHLHHFSIEVDEDITCRVYFRTFLYVITDDGSYIEVNQNSQYVTPNCDYEGDFDQFPLLVLDDDTNDSWVNTNFIENGDQTFRVDLSGLDPDRQYNLWGSVSNRYGSEYFSWGDFNPAERPSYIEVDMTIDEWTCEVGLNLYIYMYMLDGGSRYIRSGTEYTDSPCVDVGDVELEIDSDDVGYSMGLENGSNQMSWNLTDLAANQSYTFEWRVEYNDDHVMYGTETWDTGGNTSALIEWVMDIDTSITCNARVYYRTFIDTTGSDDWFQMDSGDYSEYFSCNEYVYPEDYYVSFYGNINGTWQDNPDVLPFGNDAVQIQFENMSEGANYRLYLYHSGTGFNSFSENIHFTYDGGPMDIEMPIAPWACSISYSWNLYLYDFRYETGTSGSYSNWYMGADSGSLNGPCISSSYDSSDTPDFNLTDGSGSGLTSDHVFSETNNTVVLTAENVQSDFPYYMEARIYFNNYLNIYENSMWFGNNTDTESLTLEFDVPGFVCDVDIRAYMYVRTSSGNTELFNEEDLQNLDGPCDGSGNYDDARLSTPLYAYLDGNWTLVDGDTVIPAGETEYYWDLSALSTEEEVYFYSGGNTYWSGYVDGNDHPLEFSYTISEYKCDLYFYQRIEFRSGDLWTGSHSTGNNYVYPGTDCIEESGEITIDIQDQDGNWMNTDNGYGYDLPAGTTNLSWNLTELIEGVDYEFYYYVSGNYCCDYTYEYFTADSTGTMSFDFDVTIDIYECNIYWYAYLRPMSEYTGNYESVDSFSFRPEEPCYPPFNLTTTDADGNMTVDAMDPGFSLMPGENHMFMDFGHMDNGTQYEVDYYFSDSDGGNGWFYDLMVYVDLSDNIPDGVHFNMTMDSFDCDAYLDVRVYNRTDGQNNQMFNRNIYFDGPCQKPVSLIVEGVDANEMDSMDLSLGDNNLTWAFDYLEDGIDYRLQWYYSNDSAWMGWYYEYFTYNGSNDVEWNMHVSTFDCTPMAYAQLMYDSNGSSIGNSEYWYFYVPDCADVYIDVLDENGDYANSNDYGQGTHNLTWQINNLPEGYEYAYEWRVYKNGYLQSYQHALFMDNGSVNLDFSIDIGPEVCDARVSGSLYYLSDESSNTWNSITSRSQYFYPDCNEYQNLYPWTILTDADGDGNYTEVEEYGNIGGNQTMPFAIDVSHLSLGDTSYTIQYQWETESDNFYGSTTDITANENVFYFDVPLTTWDCEVRIYIYLRYENFQGHFNYMQSRWNYFETDCVEPGNVSLNMDGMGEVWDDWSNLNNGTNNMSWELTDLNIGAQYTLDWYVRLNYDYVLYEHQTWVATGEEHSMPWGFSIDNSTTCNLEVRYRLFVDSSDTSTPNWIDMKEQGYYWYPSCDEYVYPEDNYVSVEFDINGTWVENPDEVPAGETEIRAVFENLSVGATYRMYFYYSSTGFPSNSDYIYFTYDGNPMELTVPIAPWGCSMYFNWDLTLYDFRYPGDDYNSWYMGSDNFNVDGPCDSLSYNSSDYPDFSILDQAGNQIDDDYQTSNGSNTVVISVDNLQDGFPYAAELEVRYDGYLNFFESHMLIVDNFSSAEFDFTFDVPGFVCDVTLYATLYVKTDTYSNMQLNSTYLYPEGPCDGTEGHSQLSSPLYADINGTWVLVDDDTMILPGETEMYYDISWMGDTQYYFSLNAPGYGWSDWVTSEDGPIGFSITISEFDCDPYFYSYMRQESQFSGWHYYEYAYLYPETDCLEEAGGISLEIQDEDGNWSSYMSHESYDLLPGTTSMSWELTDLLEGYEYEFYWYINSEYYCESRSHTTCTPDSDDTAYVYFTPNSTTTTMSLDFDLTIDQFLCDMAIYAYLRPMSEYTGSYDEVASFNFYPEEPCYPPFNLFAADDDGNMTVDALDSGFSLDTGVNNLFFDFGHMDNGSEYRLEWYYDDSDGWHGWFYDEITVNTTDNLPDGIEFNMTMDSFDCQAYFYASVYNLTDGQYTNMYSRTRYIDGPCNLPIDIDSYDNSGSNEVEAGTNEMTWVIDHLDEGSNYTLQYYYSMTSGFYGWYYYDFVFNGTEHVDFSVNVTDWDCNVNAYAMLYNTTDGNNDNVYTRNFYFGNNDCYYVSLEIADGDGDYLDRNIDGGTTELLWIVEFGDDDDLAGHEFELSWYYVIDNDWSNQISDSYTWTQSSNDGMEIPWNLTVTDFTCNVYSNANLRVNTSDGWLNVRGYGMSLYPPCDEIPNGWYDLQLDDGGTWVDIPDGWNNLIEDAGIYNVRFNASMLEEGITYYMTYSAHVYGHEIGSDTVLLNSTDGNETVELALVVPHWYCGMELHSSLSFEHDGTMFELVSREYYDNGPCQTDLSTDFTDSLEVELSLQIIDDGDYELHTYYASELGGDVQLWMDAQWGNMDGTLNASEASLAFSEINEWNDETPDDSPPFQLNGMGPSTWTLENPSLDEAWLNNTSSPMTLWGSWTHEFHDIFGVEIVLTIPVFQDEGDVPTHITLNGDLDESLELVSGYIDYENGSSHSHIDADDNVTHVQLTLDGPGNYTLGAVWVLTDIPEPDVSIESYDNSTGTYGEFTGIVEGWNQLQVSLANLSQQEYMIHHSVHLDGSLVQNGSTTIPADVTDFGYVIGGILDIFTCDVEIRFSIEDSFGEVVNSTVLLLEGICAQTEFTLSQHFPAQESPEYVCHEIAGDPTSNVQYVNFSLVNDGTEDCGDGADEPFDMDLSTDSDGDGDPTNDPDSWYDCYDMTTISMSLVNDGNNDCSMGEDEYFYTESSVGPPTTAMGFSDGEYDYSMMFEASAFNLSGTSNWSITYEVVIDGVESNSSGNYTIPAGLVDSSLWIEVATNIESCYIEISVSLIENDNATSAYSESYNLTGECVEDTDSDGYLDWYDRFPDDPEEWDDTDGDGLGDNADELPTDPNEQYDSDGDGVGDNGDAFPLDSDEQYDSDGDGVGDNGDAFPLDPNETTDTDGDGTGDNADTDADGDGTDDSDEDSDGDGINDDLDDFPFDANETTDTDGDGVGDNADDFPNDANETTDSDGDGVGDNEDEDADGDGVPNGLDDFPLNSDESNDADGDGVGDAEDAFPNNPNEYRDSDGDGVGDNADDDDDNDGTLDGLDAFPFDASESSDMDGDGYGDNSDAFTNDPTEWNDYDGDGVGDNSDAFITDPAESRDSDSDGIGDNADAFPFDGTESIDTDGDGVGDNSDAFPNNASEDSDSDGDGVGDNSDAFPNDETEQKDSDGDGIGDNADVEEPDSGSIIPGFGAIAGIASILGAAILVASRRKD